MKLLISYFVVRSSSFANFFCRHSHIQRPPGSFISEAIRWNNNCDDAAAWPLLHGRQRQRHSPVRVGRFAAAWVGTAYIDGKYIKSLCRRPSRSNENPRLQALIQSDSPANPMLAGAIVVDGQYAVHGTTVRARSMEGPLRSCSSSIIHKPAGREGSEG
jgi:hypothetical protein